MNWSRRLSIVFLNLLLVNTINTTKTNTLQSATDKLAELARVTNGFTVQSELTNDPKLFSAITSELLGIGSTTLLDTLLGFNSSVSNDLNILFDGIQNAKISKVDTVQVGDKINAIKLMTDKVDDLTKGITVNVDDFTPKLQKAKSDFKYNQLKIETFTKLSTALSTVLTSQPTNKTNLNEINIILAMLDMIKGNFREFRFSLPIYGRKDLFGSLWDLEGTYESVLKPIMEVSEMAKQYNQNVLKPESLAGDLDLMIDDVKSLANLLTLSQKDTNGAQMVKVVQEIEASLKVVPTRSRTLGFMNGVSDIQLLFKDLKGEWLKKNIGNGESIAKLVPKLEKLKTFAEKVVPLESSWSKFSNDSTSRDAAKTVSDLLHQAQVSSKSVQNTAALTESFGKISQSVVSLKSVNLNPKIKDFDKYCNEYEKLDKAITQMRSFFETTANSEHFTKIVGLGDQLNDAIVDFSDMPTLIKTLDDIRAIPDITPIAALINETLRNWNTIVYNPLYDVLTEVKAWNVAKEIQTSLGSTGLVPALTSIKTLKYDAQEIDSFVKFSDNVRTIQAKSTEVTGTKIFLTELSAVVATGNTAKSSTQSSNQGTRSRRQPPVELDSFVANQLGTAVQTLQNMAVVSEKKTKVIGLADAKASVTAAVVAVAQDVWTDGNRAAMKSTVVEVEKLEKFVQGLANDDWDTLVKVFDEAAKVKGAPIDTKKFTDPIGVALEKSTDADVKAAAVEFRDLSTLELDFASKERDLKTASLTLNPIRAFFDQVLGISRIQQVTQSSAVQSSSTQGPEATSGSVREPEATSGSVREPEATAGSVREPEASFTWAYVVIGILVAVILICGLIVFFGYRKLAKAKKEEDEESKKKTSQKEDEKKENKKEDV